MEVDLSSSHMNRTWTSEGKFKLQWSQGYKDSLQIENRVRILEQQKNRKIKEIEKKLQNHKKCVQLKIHKHNRHQDISRMHQNHQSNVSMYYNYFQSDKKKREDNIRNIKAELVKSKVKQFQQYKKQSEKYGKKIIQEKNEIIQLKIQKRNKVRLMEIQAKQNIVTSWNKRLNQMRDDRKKVLDKKVKEHSYNLASISKMQKKQRKILKQISDTQKMEEQLGEMIQNESIMGGLQLSALYTNS